MLLQWLIVLHVAVLGYWLGSELVINSTFRFVSLGTDIPFSERSRMMDHVMNVDQHVRYALVFQAGLGFAISALYGYIPGGPRAALIIGLLALLGLAFVELVHRQRSTSLGKRLALVDRSLRYVAILLLGAAAAGWIGTGWAMPGWLRWKLALFAGVIACGIGIRFGLMRFFRTWAVMARDGPDERTNRIIRQTYWRSTSVLVLLWLLIAGIVLLSVLKPDNI